MQWHQVLPCSLILNQFGKLFSTPLVKLLEKGGRLVSVPAQLKHFHKVPYAGSNFGITRRSSRKIGQKLSLGKLLRRAREEWAGSSCVIKGDNAPSAPCSREQKKRERSRSGTFSGGRNSARTSHHFGPRLRLKMAHWQSVAPLPRFCGERSRDFVCRNHLFLYREAGKTMVAHKNHRTMAKPS